MFGMINPASIKENIKKLIAENKHKQAIDLLIELVGADNDTLNEVIQQSARLENLRKSVNSGVLSFSEAGQEFNKIISALLNITDSIVPSFQQIIDVEPPIQNSFSKKFGQSLQKLNIAWGTGLAFSFIGLMLIVIANFNESSEYQAGAFWVGTILIVLSFLFFLFLQLKGTLKITNSFKENQDTINELQNISLNLTRMTKRAANYSIANSNNIKKLLDAVIPSLKRLGLITEQNESQFSNSNKVIDAIINYSEDIEDTIKQLEKALIEGDSQKLQEFAKKTKELSSKVNLYVEKLSKLEVK